MISFDIASIVSIFQLIIVFNTFLLAGIIFSRYAIAHPSALIMAVTMAVLGLQMVGNLYLNSQSHSTFENIFSIVHRSFAYLYGPLLFFYVASALRISIKYWQVHLVPFILYISASAFGWYSYNILVATIFMSMSLYLLVGWYSLLTIKISKDRRKNFSTNQSPKLLLSAMSAVVILNITQKISELYYPDITQITESLVYISLLLLLITLFYVSLNESKRLFSKNKPQYTDFFTTGEVSQPSIDNQEILLHLREIIEKNQIYLDPQFSLRNLARKAVLAERLVSSVINTELDQSFTDFINHYRIRHAQTLFSELSYKEIGILGVALASGFNAKSTFNRVFKKHTGQTAKEFRNNLNL